MKSIDWSKPIRFKGAKKPLRLVTHAIYDGRLVYFVVNPQANGRAISHMVLEDGSMFGHINHSHFSVENVPEQKRIPLTYNDFRHGVILKKGNMTWIPHYIDDKGVAMIASSNYETKTTFQELAEDNEIVYRTFDSSIWKSCYKLVEAVNEVDDEDDDDEDLY